MAMGISFGTCHGGFSIHSFILDISVARKDLTVNLMHYKVKSLQHPRFIKWYH